MAIDPFYIITRFAKSVFTGPVKPTPGTAMAYIRSTEKPDKKYGFDFNAWGSEHRSDSGQQWPGIPPIDIYIQNKAKIDPNNGEEDSITLVGVNPGNLSDSGSPPEFSPQKPLGRSSPYQIYSGGGTRTVRAQITLHRDAFRMYNPNLSSKLNTYEDFEKYSVAQGFYEASDDPELQNIGKRYSYSELMNQSNEMILQSFVRTLNWFRSLEYPIYAQQGVIAPRVYMRIGKFLVIEGWPQVGISYDNIFSEGYPVKATIDLSVNEALEQSYDQISIKKGAGMYVKW